MTLSNAQKTPLSKSLNAFAQTKAMEAIDQLGKALPGHVVAVDGAIVTVAFDVNGLDLPQVTMPVATSTYIRLPIQAATDTYSGDLGVAFPASLYLGGISGLGGGTADTTPRGSLSCLVWVPVGNANWTVSSNPNALDLNAPDGVILRDDGNKTVATLTPDGFNVLAQDTYEVTAGTEVSFSSNGFSITISEYGIILSGGGHTLTVGSAGIVMDNLIFADHKHTGVTTGSGDTGVVTS